MESLLAVSDGVGIELSSRLGSKQVLLPQQSLTSVFGMGTGGPSALKSLITLDQSKDKRINEYQNPKLKLILEPVTDI